ncbi:hypothetical protein J8L88_04715 [Aquimarina sp. MMG015]|uniref:hypothetical protein n=1 Tax=Aquimarina TaxID=290174 RepID=UPI00040475FC|nr:MULTISPECIES: hypothetical protein [Aquimarina]MBQ4802148.1 hypothetical protein [Aquimarina sp. MMG015]
MPIKSYLAHPYQGKKDQLISALSSLENCEVIPAKNQELLIVVTDTNNSVQEDILREKLETISSLKLLAMVSGFNTPN